VIAADTASANAPSRKCCLYEFFDSPWTQAGFSDARRHRPFRVEYEQAPSTLQWWYEWGRQLALDNPALHRIAGDPPYRRAAQTALSRSLFTGALCVRAGAK
jgi:hypothetical protein